MHCYEAKKKGENTMPYNSKAFISFIFRLRIQKSLSQKAASRLTGIYRSHLIMLKAIEKP